MPPFQRQAFSSVRFLPLLPELEPHHANQDDGETGDETEQDQHISVVTIRIEAE